MFKLFFGDVMSVVTTVFVLAMFAFIVLAFINRGRITKWGRLILIFILAGTAISAFSATRDAFAMENAVFAMFGLQSAVCAIAGAAIVLLGLVMLFLKKQGARKAGFMMISALFLVQVMTVEVSRVILL
jgi:hypothetical protein